MTEFGHTTVKAPRYQKRLCRMVSALALCLTSITHLAATAQEEFIEPPSRLLTKVPFIQLTGGIIIMQAKLDNFPDTLNFVLDTGSSGISLDSNTAEYLGLKPEPTNKTIRGIAGIKNVSFL